MDPVTIMAGVGMASTFAGGIAQMFGEDYTAKAQANQQKFQAGLALQRAQVDEQNARWAQNEGETNALAEGLKGRYQREMMVADMGARGVGPQGSAGAVFRGQTYATQLDETITRTNAARRQYGQLVGAATERAQAGADIIAAQNILTGRKFAEAGTALGTIGGVSTKWMQASQAGVGTNVGDQMQDFTQDIMEG